MEVLQFLFYLVCWILLSIVVSIFAHRRGHHFLAGLYMALLLSPVGGALLVMVARDRVAEARHRELLDALRGRVAGETAPCPTCAEPVMRAAVLCRHCRTAIQPAPLEDPDDKSEPKPRVALDPAIVFGMVAATVVLVLMVYTYQLGSTPYRTDFSTFTDEELRWMMELERARR